MNNDAMKPEEVSGHRYVVSSHSDYYLLLDEQSDRIFTTADQEARIVHRHILAGKHFRLDLDALLARIWQLRNAAPEDGEEVLKGAFIMERDGTRLGEMTYSMAGDKAIIEHTLVNCELRGTGTGKKLVEAAVQWARAARVKIVPRCPFARSMFDKTPAYADVLAT